MRKIYLLNIRILYPEVALNQTVLYKAYQHRKQHFKQKKIQD
jgi:hypothetical protein